MLRFAGPVLARGLRALYPALRQGSLRAPGTWRGAAGDIAMDVLPNVAFAGLAGAALPGADPATGFEGASMGDRVAASLFDAAVSTPVGMAGRLGGAGLARAVGAVRRRPVSPGGEMMLQTLGGMGSEFGLYGSGLLRNPVTDHVLDRYNEAYAQAEETNNRALREQIIAEERDRVRREQEALTGYGGLGAALAPFGFGGFG
jgi:hypothetical protein